MTTAHRPTWHTAKGGTEQGGNVLVNPSRAYSSKDMPAHTSMKQRSSGQGNLIEQNRLDFKAELLRQEAQASSSDQALAGQKRLHREVDEPLQLQDNLDEQEDHIEYGSDDNIQQISDSHQITIDQKNHKAQLVRDTLISLPLIENPFAQDLDCDNDQFVQMADFWNKLKKQEVLMKDKNAAALQEQSADETEYGDEDDSSEEDDAVELMREYEKLKKEREEEKRLKELAKMEEIKRRQQEEVLHGNPLLNAQLSDATSQSAQGGGAGTYSLKRKWFEETVFRHYARNEPVEKKRFVNDTVRRDFHRRFLSRTIQ